jgi:hypothetical protein
VQIGNLTTWDFVNARIYSSHAIKTNNTLWVWGQQAQNAVGVNADNTVPTQVGASTGWVSVATGEAHAAGISA